MRPKALIYKTQVAYICKRKIFVANLSRKLLPNYTRDMIAFCMA